MGAPPLFAEQSRGRQALILIVIPFVFGAVMGLALRWSAWAWWGVQALGVVGAIYAGREHQRRWPAAIRGGIGGLLAAAAVAGVRAVASGADVADFDPVSYPVTAAVASAALHVAGTTLRRRGENYAG